MYSTKLKNSRIIVKCISNADKISIQKFIVDTGAKYTCIAAESLDYSLMEEDFKTAEIRTIGGFVKDDKTENIKFYKYSVKQFTIGDVDLGNADIWITFDKRISDPVLGFDLLSKIGFAYDEKTELMHFSKNFRDIIDYFSKE